MEYENGDLPYSTAVNADTATLGIYPCFVKLFPIESNYCMAELPKHFDHKNLEPEIYKRWEQSGFFNPDNLPGGRSQPFAIMMPPPNVTGVLHMGHAMATTIQDILIRYKRMHGFKALWVPGTDHAAIATQSKVEKMILKDEDKSRHDLGREEFLKRVTKFAQESHDTIISQTKRLGASCDWSREAFTLDDQRSLAVRTLFKMMYDDGLIYRAHRVVNWDPKGQTTIADDEIVYQERETMLYTFKYSKDFPITIASTQPETKLGDTAVAVHPDDERYKEFVGKTYEIKDFGGEPLTIKVVADASVEASFGTGALGVTPAHSMVDYEIAQRHNLPLKQVINEYAKLTVGAEGIKGKKTTEAREAVVAWLRSQDLLQKEEKIKQNVPTAERTGGIIEPLPKLQWFIAVDKEFKSDGGHTTLKKIMRKPVEGKAVTVIPDYFDKTYFHWIDNLRDWCISRQIWYGHRIPVWYKGDQIHVDVNPPKGDGWEQDPDTLDTWFSAGMWTFSTLGWPEKTKDLEIYHPTDVLETGYEILFFWVARMIMMSGYALKQIPFKTVYLHGTVRDDKGRKMSKSLGNGIDPIDIADEFGADAGRMALVVGMSPGTDTKIAKDKIRGYRNFTTKVWNMAKFILQYADAVDQNDGVTERDVQVLKELADLKAEVTKNLDEYKLHLAAESLYHYVWHTVADKIIEEYKPRLSGTDEADKAMAATTLMKVFSECLKMLHPFMPFVTEELWAQLPIPNKKMLMVESW